MSIHLYTIFQWKGHLTLDGITNDNVTIFVSTLLNMSYKRSSNKQNIAVLAFPLLVNVSTHVVESVLWISVLRERNLFYSFRGNTRWHNLCQRVLSRKTIKEIFPI